MRLVLVGRIGGEPVKVYEAHSSSHAEFLAALTDSEIGTGFPAVLGRADRFLVCAWAAGKSAEEGRIGRDAIARIATFQAALHGADTSLLPASDFDYWRDIIAPRFIRASELAGCASLADEAIKLVEGWRSSEPATINHPDLTLSNIIWDDQDRLVSIDNELIYVAPGAFMDVANTLSSLPAAHRSFYYDCYRAADGARPLPDPRVIDAFWLARRAGSLFVAGRIGALQEVFSAFRAGRHDAALEVIRSG